MRRVRRLVLAAIAAGAAGGAVAGLGARLIMFAVRLDNPAFNGATTHQSHTNGQWTLEGTLSVVTQGISGGILAGVLYLPLRRFMGGRPLTRGVVFGVLVLVWMGGAVLDGSYEYARFVSPSVSVSAFAALFPLYGIVVAATADAIAPMGPPRLPRWRPAGQALIALAAVAGAWQLVRDLRFRYGF